MESIGLRRSEIQDSATAFFEFSVVSVPSVVRSARKSF